jgi:hypothetical protein
VELAGSLVRTTAGLISLKGEAEKEQDKLGTPCVRK